MNSLFYPYIDPVTGLPIIDAHIMASLDPNTVRKNNDELQNEMNFNQISMNLSMSMTGAGGGYSELPTPTTNYDEFSINENSQSQYTAYDDQSSNIQCMNSYSQSNYDGNSFIEILDNYNINDYNNPKNYDLYYQSLYQMYPQMSDYVKKQVEFDQNKLDNKPQMYSKPCVLFNMGILDPQTQDNNLYDPNFISEYFRMNLQREMNSQQNDQKQEGEGEVDDLYDPHGIRSEIGDMSGIIKINEDGQPQQQLNNIQKVDKDNVTTQNQTIDYSKYDYNKYIEHMYSNQGNKRQKNNQKRPQSYRVDYDKNEVNEDVNRFYESFYKEELSQSNHSNVNNIMINTEKIDSNIISQSQVKEHEFEKPFAMPKRRSRFDDGGPSTNSNSSVNNNRPTEDIKIEPINENKYYEK